MSAPTGLASTVLDALDPDDLGEPRSVAPFVASGHERETCDIDQVMVDDGGTDDFNDEDYGNRGATTNSKIGGRPRSRKRVGRTKDIENNDVATLSTHDLDASDQAIAENLSSGVHESEEIPIHGYFTLKTIASKVVYCLTFSQELLPRPRDPGQRQDCVTDLEGPQSAAPIADDDYQWGIHKIVGQKMVGCERHYRVEWKDTWMPETELTRAKELVDAFMANDGSGITGRKRPLKRGRAANGLPDAQDGERSEKRRGRPRKQNRGGIVDAAVLEP